MCLEIPLLVLRAFFALLPLARLIIAKEVEFAQDFVVLIMVLKMCAILCSKGLCVPYQFLASTKLEGRMTCHAIPIFKNI